MIGSSDNTPLEEFLEDLFFGSPGWYILLLFLVLIFTTAFLAIPVLIFSMAFLAIRCIINLPVRLGKHIWKFVVPKREEVQI